MSCNSRSESEEREIETDRESPEASENGEQMEYHDINEELISVDDSNDSAVTALPPLRTCSPITVHGSSTEVLSKESSDSSAGESLISLEQPTEESTEQSSEEIQSFESNGRSSSSSEGIEWVAPLEVDNIASPAKNPRRRLTPFSPLSEPVPGPSCGSSQVEPSTSVEDAGKAVGGKRSLADELPTENRAKMAKMKNNPNILKETFLQLVFKQDLCMNYAVGGEILNAPTVVIADIQHSVHLAFPMFLNDVFDVTIGLFDKFHRHSGNGFTLELKHFEIVNPAWDNHLPNVVSQVKVAMGVDLDLNAVLQKFVLLTGDSCFKLNASTDRPTNTFGKMVIALPSLIDGVQHMATLGDDSIKFDTSSSSFSTFFFAFHRDCDYKLSEINEGIGSYLVYDLVSNSANIPKAPSSVHFEMENRAKQIISECKGDDDMVFFLSENYMKMDLQLEDLKSTDLKTAVLLKRLCAEAPVQLFFGYMELSLQKETEYENTNFNTKKPSEIRSKEYSLVKLKLIDGTQIVNCNIPFDTDVSADLNYDFKKPEHFKRYPQRSYRRADVTNDVYYNENPVLGYRLVKQYLRPVFYILHNDTLFVDFDKLSLIHI